MRFSPSRRISVRLRKLIPSSPTGRASLSSTILAARVQLFGRDGSRAEFAGPKTRVARDLVRAFEALARS